MSTPDSLSTSVDVVQRLAEAITPVHPFVVMPNANIVLPPGVAAADGVDIQVALAVCHESAVSQDRIQRQPELVVEFDGRRHPRLHDLAWRWLRVPDIWLIEPGRSTITASIDTGGGARSVEVMESDFTVVRAAWSCHVAPEILFG